MSKLKIIKQNLTAANNLGLESKAQFFSFFNGSEDLCKLHAEAKKIDAHVQIIGAGTNTIFPRAFDKLVIKSSDKSISEKKVKNNILVTAGAALIWDDLIDFCVEKKYCGLANLAGIPGTDGAAPVQNIGAYGVELSDLLEEVLCFDLKTQKEVVLSNSDCVFSYRSSIFQSNPHLIILQVTLKLSSEFKPLTTYKDLENTNPTDEANFVQIVREIRDAKLPNPTDFPNIGSFFKNPIMSDKDFHSNDKLQSLNFQVLDDGNYKLSAAQILEASGLKGAMIGNVGMSSKHSLVLICNGLCDASNVKNFEDLAKKTVHDNFGVILEREPIYL